MKKPAYILFIMFLSGYSSAYSQELSLAGMASAWAGAGYSDRWTEQLGARYIPGLEFTYPLKQKLNIEGEFSGSFAGSYTNPSDEDKLYYKAKPYRMWLKLSGNQFEMRAGLQKINFGSASMLRPLMWFDQLDPRDPLQLTDGVYGILGRYYTLNNTNIWIWALYGNKTKGWEAFQTEKGTVEYGGRLQLPVPKAEIGMTFHHRMAEIEYINPFNGLQSINIPENRFAIDIRANLALGLWIEDAVNITDSPYSYNYTNMLTLGADYTFGIGSGLKIMAENLTISLMDGPSGNRTTNITATSVSYPLSIIANLSAIIYYDWNQEEVYRFLNLGLTYDRFSFYLMGFWNPQNLAIFDLDTAPSIFNGRGFQLMAVFNH
jgi:hypothetical protein